MKYYQQLLKNDIRKNNNASELDNACLLLQNQRRQMSS